MAIRDREPNFYVNYEDSGGFDAISDQQIADFVSANLGNPAAIAAAADAYGISIADISRATGYATNDINNYFESAQVAAPSSGQTAAQAAALQAENEAAVQRQAAQEAAAAKAEAAAQAAAERQAAIDAAAANAARQAAAAQAAADKAAAEAEARAEAARTAAQQAAAQRAAEAAAAAQAAADKAKADAAAQQKAAADAAAKAQADAQAKAQADAQAKAQAEAQAKAQADAQAKAAADAEAKAQADAAAKVQAEIQAKAQADAQAKAQADALAASQAATKTTAKNTVYEDNAAVSDMGLASLPAANVAKTYTQAEINQKLVDALKNDPNASKADITAAAAGLGITADQVNAAYNSLPAATQPAGIASLPAAKTQAAAQTAAPMDKAAAVEKITQQILAQGMTGKWKGEGKGSAEANARDMAKIIADTGATDITQFGKVTQYVPVDAIGQLYNGQLVRASTDEYGNTISYIQKSSGQYDADGNEIPSIEVVPQNAKLTTAYGQFDGENFSRDQLC